MTATLTEITELKATTAATLVATFAEATPEDTTIEVTKGAATVDGTVAWNEARTEVTFTATANLQTGTYTLTAKSGETTVSKEVEVKEQDAAEIVIKSETALTSHDKKDAYIYYDVLDQYGESMLDSVTINWTVSSCDSFKVNKSIGKITAHKAGDSDVFNYGAEIYVTGVYVKTGLSVTKSVKVGMEQALDSIKFAGFLNKDDKTKTMSELPKDFAADKYVLLYTTFDQEGNEMDAADDNITESRVTFITSNVMLIKSEFNDDVIYTIEGKEYSSVNIQPGMYVDKGGEVIITAISNTTGQKTEMVFNIGAAPVLKSLALETPAKAIADGDRGVELPYVAKDIDGNEITRYETIVRSTNTLNIVASEGTLTISQKDDGTAKITWSDDDYDSQLVADKYDPESVNIWNRSDTHDGVDRNISLVTTVIGGESNSMLLPVSDARRPDAIKEVKIAATTGNDEGIVVGQDFRFSIVGGLDAWNTGITYLDQYGEVLAPDKAKAFFNATKTNANNKSGAYDGYQYGIYVDVNANNKLSLPTTSGAINLYDGGEYSGSESIHMNAQLSTNATSHEAEVVTNTVKYSIVKAAKAGADLADPDDWETVGKTKVVTYTIVPTERATGFSVDQSGLLKIHTANSEKENGMSDSGVADNIAKATTMGAITLEGIQNQWNPYLVETINGGYTVKAAYKGMSLNVPSSSISSSAESDIALDASKAMKTVVDGALHWNDLYDENSPRLLRKNASLKFTVDILNSKDDTFLSTATKTVELSDAVSKATSVALNTWSGPLAQPTTCDFTIVGTNKVEIKDQYGQVMSGVPFELNLDGVVENTDDDAHLSDSFAVSGNGTQTLTIKGAEIKDTFKLTVNVTGTNVTTSADLTVSADAKANITNKSSDNDKDLRAALGYDR